ncbi:MULTISPECIES: ATP-binding cassette domain-containing protein [unclassified Sutcliffiella]|uniref:ABC transporter ATP-binding protein n=1 Tax=unclassified Sutcliffiella TaxID=2837532 RepID=UPI0030D2AD32
MSEIILNNVSKYYKSYKIQNGIKGRISDFVNRKYFNIPAVSNMNLKVNKGEIVGLLGENGAGKTTTMKLMTGILHNSLGEISVLGHTPLHRKKQFLKSISFVMGNRSQLIWDLPALDSFKFQKHIYEIPNNTYRFNLERLVSLLGVEELLNIQVRRLSLGQRMKMELINSLLHHPQVVLLDEPTIGLDLQSQKNIRKFLLDYNRETNATIVLTSHYMEDIKSTCKRIVIMRKGEKVYDDNITELKKNFNIKKTIHLTFEGTPNIFELERIGKVMKKSENLIVLTPFKFDKYILSNIASQFQEVRDISIQEEDVSNLIENIMYKDSRNVN